MLVNKEFYNEIKSHIPMDSTINKVYQATREEGIYAVIEYTVSDSYKKEFDLYYGERVLEILLIPNLEWCGDDYTTVSILSYAKTI